MRKKRIVLASASPRRSELMKQAGFTFEIQVSKKEEVYQSERPDEIVEELSLLKAEDVAQSLEQENVIVIGADTVVALDGKILGKPKSKERCICDDSESARKRHIRFIPGLRF